MIDLLFGVYHCGRAAVNVKSHKIGRCFSGIFLTLSGGTTKKRGIYRREGLFAGKTFVRRVRSEKKNGRRKRKEETVDVSSFSAAYPSMWRPRKAAMVWASLYSASPVAMPGAVPMNSTSPSRSPSARMGAATLVMSLSLLSETRMG